MNTPEKLGYVSDMTKPRPLVIDVPEASTYPQSGTSRSMLPRLTLISITVVTVIAAITLGYFRMRTANVTRYDNSSNQVPHSQNSTDPQNNQPQPQETPKNSGSTAQRETTPTTNNAGSTPGQDVQTIACGVVGMPPGVCDLINSIESQGLKNNYYVNADTSQVPDSNKVIIENDTWKSGANDKGTIQFRAQLGDNTYNGTANLSLTASGWRVIDYTLK